MLSTRTQLEPSLAAALAVHAAPGVYALLLGSGISRPAKIYTGWDITKDLATRIAIAEEKKEPPEIVAWYRNRFGEEPNYSKLIGMLAPTRDERRRLLEPYFERTPEDSDDGAKRPTKAHKAIARLVAGGYIRVIVTTNFDRLLEQALDEANVTPQVIFHHTMVDGMVPLVHSPCTIFKIHGDYKDTRILNTDEELGSYESPAQKLLSEITNDFGLIVSGWSAKWDPALCNVIGGSSRRYSMFWTHTGDLEDAAKQLIDYRHASKIKVDGADAFFTSLLDRIESLESLRGNHPLTAKVAAATVKRLVADENRVIDLHDLLKLQASEVNAGAWDESKTPLEWGRNEPVKTLDSFARLENLSESLIYMIATATLWAKEQHYKLICETIERAANMPPASRNRSGGDIEFRSYPASLAFHACVTAALLTNKLALLRILLNESRVPRSSAKPVLVLSCLPAPLVAHEYLPGTKPFGHKASPGSWKVADYLRRVFTDLLVNEDAFDRAFDDSEILLMLVYEFHRAKGEKNFNPYIFLPGRFVSSDKIERLGELETEFSRSPGEWPFYTAKLFGNSTDEIKAAFEGLKEWRKNTHAWSHYL